MTTLTAVLFVGGESRRMGADKATLIVNGEPLWTRQLNVLRQLRPEALLISARAKPVWCPSDVECILDAEPSRGPLSGLAAALRQAQTTHLLAMAIDLPRITVGHLEMLRRLAEKGCGVIPQSGDFFEPLCAIYPKEAAAATVAALNNGEFSLQRLVTQLVHQKQMGVCPISENEKALYHNANTPADLASLREK